MGIIGDFSKEAKLIINLNTCEIHVKKINEETNEPIEGVTFELFNEKGETVGTATTNADGMAFFENLYPGDYQIKEIATRDDLALNPEKVNVTVEYDNIVTKTITNGYKKGSLQIIKKDAETELPIAGVSFDLLDVNGNVVQTGITDEKGEILFEDLVVGKYQLQEKETNENYVLKTEAIDVVIEHNQTTIQEIENESKKGSLQIYKVDKENHEKPLSNVVFELYSKESEQLIGTYTTDENGKIFINNLKIGEYQLREIVTKEGYEIGENVNISIEYAKTTEVTIENKKKPEIPEEPSKPEKPFETPKEEVKKLPKTGF